MEARILVVEDDPDLAESTAMILAEEGFAPLVAADLDSAFELACGRRPDVALVDLSLEGDLFEFIQRLRALPGWAGAIFIFSARDRLEERARQVGADGCLAKPFGINDLLALLRAVCPAETNP